MSETVETLNLSKDFSPYPAGRHRRDGRFSGEKFRDDMLWPLLKQPNVTVRILIDGVAGLPSSFWEEVFGGLVRQHHMKASSIKERVRVETTDADLTPYIQLAYSFATDAASSSGAR